MKHNINIGDTVYFETVFDTIESMVVCKIDGKMLYEENGSFLEKSEVLSERDPRVIAYKKEHPIEEITLQPSNQNIKLVAKASQWLKEHSGKTITKKFIDEFINYMNYDEV